MIIAGAGSAGKETSGLLMQQSDEDIIFFDQKYKGDKIWERFIVISDFEALKLIIKTNPSFCVAIGNPRKRKKLFEKISSIGGKPKNIISKNINSISPIAEKSIIIQPGVAISYDVFLGKSCIIHTNSTIGHKVSIGDFVNISPLCSIIGPCKIGNESYIGAHSVIMPGVIIGNNAYIPVGSIVKRDVLDFETFE